MKEIIDVQKEINEIQENIEAVEGRLNYLNHSSAMSTINFTFYQILDPSASATPTPENFFTKLKDALSNGWSWLEELLLGLIGIWPLVLAIVLVMLFLRKKQFFKVRPQKV